jgi:hypothetical protein
MMPVTYASAPINDQLIPVFEGAGLWGLNSVGPVWHGNGQRPPQSIPTGITSPVMAASATPSTAFTNASTTGNGTALLVIAAAMGIIGLLGLHFIHWRR